MALVKPQRILRHHVKRFAEDRPCFAVHGVRVAGSVDVGARAVDLGVDREGCGVDGFVAEDYVAGFVDEDEVADGDLGKVH